MNSYEIKVPVEIGILTSGNAAASDVQQTKVSIFVNAESVPEALERFRASLNVSVLLLDKGKKR